MAYLIGNTTVISNNAALGSIDGNALNLSNNPNLTAGGASATLKTSTTNAAVVGSTYAIVVSSGGGGGGSTYNEVAAGTTSLTSLSFHDVSGGGNATFTVGAAGTGGYQSPFSNNNIKGFNGGATDFTYNGTEYGNPYSSGGRRGYDVYTSVANRTGYSTIHSAGGSGNPNTGLGLLRVTGNSGFLHPYGAGGNAGGYNVTQAGSGGAGAIFMLGF